MNRILVSAVLGTIAVSCNAPPAQLPVAFPLEAQTAENAARRAPNFDRLSSLRGWNEQESVRRRWMFLGERAAFDWFGAPDEVSAFDGPQESWLYRRYPYAESYTLFFSKGRLVRVDPPFKLPDDDP